jgi:hypothetical protein
MTDYKKQEAILEPERGNISMAIQITDDISRSYKMEGKNYFVLIGLRQKA